MAISFEENYHQICLNKTFGYVRNHATSFQVQYLINKQKPNLKEMKDLIRIKIRHAIGVSSSYLGVDNAEE